jgi:hypothetical protein
MLSYDFEVDLPALGGAARGISETVQLFRDQQGQQGRETMLAARAAVAEVKLAPR